MSDHGPIVINCPVCRKVIWSGSFCSHGKVPEPSVEKVVEDDKEDADPPPYRDKKGRKKG